MLAWLDGDEPAATRVDAAVNAHAVMSWINVAEVYYRVDRDHGRAEAETVLGQLRRLLDLDLATPERVVQAARIKSAHAIALADCFAIATGVAHDCPLLTGDPEIVSADAAGLLVDDLRR